jgi:hypothetical protein
VKRRILLLLANIIGFLSVGTYTLSFFLPTFAIRIGEKCTVHLGYEAFEVGLVSPLNFYFGGFGMFIIWLANPVLWYAFYRFAVSRDIAAFLAGAASTLLALTLFIFGDPTQRDLVLVGYYVWVLSIALFTVAAAMKWIAVPSENVIRPRERCPDHIDELFGCTGGGDQRRDR